MSELLEKLSKLTIDKRYDAAIFCAIEGLTNTSPDKAAINTSTKLIQLLVDIYQVLPKLLLKEPLQKATYIVAIANAINNKMGQTFTPEYLTNVKTTLNYQKVAVAYMKQTFITLQKNSILLPFERVLDLNYLLNVIDLNLYIIYLSDKGRLYGNSDISNNLRIVLKRTEELIRKSPKPEYYKLQSMILIYLGKAEESRLAVHNSISAMALSSNFKDINLISYNLQHKGRLHPAMVFE